MPTFWAPADKAAQKIKDSINNRVFKSVVFIDRDIKRAITGYSRKG